jgi:hypothetical protein
VLSPDAYHGKDDAERDQADDHNERRIGPRRQAEGNAGGERRQ